MQCNINPHEIPALTRTPDLRPYCRVVFKTAMKSGPGLATANKCANATPRRIEKVMFYLFAC